MTIRISQLLHREPALVSDRPAVLRYGVAAIAVLATVGVRAALDPLLGANAPYLPFALAIMLVGRFGGRGPGLAATVLSALSLTWFFIEPRHSFSIANPAAGAGLALFVVVGVLISLFVGRLRESLLSSARAERTLRHQAELIDLSHDAIITADANRVITGWNTGAAEIYGWTEPETVGKVVHELLQTRIDVSTAEIDRILARDGRWDGELNHSARDGRQIVVESRQILVRDGRNIPVGILEINRDITDHKRADEALRQSSEQQRLALEAGGLGAWDYRFDTGDVFWDERCRKMFGVPAGGQIAYDEAIARIHPDDRAATDEAVKQAIAGANGGAFHREYRVVWPDGSVHWGASHGRVLFEGDGSQRRAVRFVGVNMDTTERRQTEERLRQTQKMESIGLLAGGIAHDFNNLLTVIMGSASAALAECPSCEHYHSILSASERAAYLTRQLLAYAGKDHVVSELVNLTELVSKSSELLSASVPKRAHLDFNLAKDLPCLETDPSRIEQILMNLVINAGEAIPAKTDGLIEITTSSCEVSADMAHSHSPAYDVVPGPFVCLEVRDNGSGMDAATVSRIFDPFFTTRFTGRGLGLAAVHGIVRTCRGFIEVRSSPGKGTTFRVFLPASEKKPPAVEVPSAPRQQLRGPATILVVEDEEMVRKLASLALKRYGYEVLNAQNGKDALQILSDSPSLPSLALIDLAMPVMGGDELAPILETKYPDLKIIVTSGYPEEEARKVFQSGSIAGFLQKPYTTAALAGKIKQVLQLR